MSRSRILVIAPCLLLPMLLSGCKARPKPPVIVRVLRDLRSPYGSEMDRRILDFQGNNPRLPSGERVVVQTETGDFKDMLQKQNSSSEDVDLIILNSTDDAQYSPAVQLAMPRAVNICAGLKACPTNVPAIVPPQISGPRRDGAQLFADFLQKPPAS